MKSYQHFTCTSARPEIVQLKGFSDSEESQFRILSDEYWTPDHLELPQCITPSGLSVNSNGTCMIRYRNSAVMTQKALYVPFRKYQNQMMSKGRIPLRTDIQPQPKRPRVVQACPAVPGRGNSYEAVELWQVWQTWPHLTNMHYLLLFLLTASIYRAFCFP